MLSGIYAVTFQSNQQMLGNGIMVIDGGTMHGGDAIYLYKGKFRLTNGNKVSIVVDVAHHSGPPNSVFGPLSKFRLILSGSYSANQFTLQGQVEGQPHLQISIMAQKKGDLIDQ